MAKDMHYYFLVAYPQNRRQRGRLSIVPGSCMLYSSQQSGEPSQMWRRNWSAVAVVQSLMVSKQERSWSWNSDQGEIIHTDFHLWYKDGMSYQISNPSYSSLLISAIPQIASAPCLVSRVSRVTTELAAGAGVEQCYHVIHTQEQCPNTPHCGHCYYVVTVMLSRWSNSDIQCNRFNGNGSVLEKLYDVFFILPPNRRCGVSPDIHPPCCCHRQGKMTSLQISADLHLHHDQAGGHARLLEPPSRASMWRMGFQAPENFDDDQTYCG